MAEDHRVWLAGYEVYRFGRAELIHEEPGRQLLEDFFTQLLDAPQPRHL